MKIALIGTHGTGKTTLALELTAGLKKLGYHAGFLGELAGKCPLPINETETPEAGKWLIHNQYVKEIDEGIKFPVLVCDRSIFDGYVYYNYKFGKNIGLEEVVKEEIKNYDFLFKIPINPNYLIEDGIRSINPKFQRDIDKKCDYLLKKFSVNYHTTNNLNDMLQIIKEKELRKHSLVFSKRQADVIFKEIK
ncbi:AAA domain protein [uncultured archaeon]|nr:AAA domain protein [uncultured archaeon]